MHRAAQAVNVAFAVWYRYPQEGCPALHLAAARGNVGALAALLGAGADVNVRDEVRHMVGVGPARARSSCEVCGWGAGADANVRDEVGTGPEAAGGKRARCSCPAVCKPVSPQHPSRFYPSLGAPLCT